MTGVRTHDDLESGMHVLALDLCRMATTVMREHAADPPGPRRKGDPSDWVTETDELIEARMRDRIHGQFPTHRVCGEEAGESGPADSRYTWVLDPIDGTCNYAHGVRWNATSITVCRDGVPVVGAVACPHTGDLFHARRGHGAWWHDTRLTPPPPLPWPGAVVLTELLNHAWWPGLPDLWQWMQDRYITVRIMGSSALAVVQTAAGRAQGTVLGQSQMGDIGAALLIAAEAGMAVRGEGMLPGGFPVGAVAVAHPAAVDELYAALAEARAGRRSRPG